MAGFIIRRIALSILVVFGVLIVTFVVTRVAPSDPARMYAGQRATAQQVEQARVKLGLNDPQYVQVVRYIYNFAVGNWGESLETKHPVTTDIKTYLPYTLELVIISSLLTTLIGVPMGVFSAAKKDRLVDHTSRVVAVGLVSVPTFWLALGLQMVFASKLHWLPLNGSVSDTVSIFTPISDITGFPLIDALVTGNTTGFFDHAVHMILPTLALTAMSLGVVQRLTRAAMVETLGEDYIVAGRSYGLPERTILWRYALKNSLGPVATVTALGIAGMLVSTFLVEAIFSWPGIGAYVSTSVLTLDYPAIVAVTTLSAIAYVVLNTVADLVLALDPRVRAAV